MCARWLFPKIAIALLSIGLLAACQVENIARQDTQITIPLSPLDEFLSFSPVRDQELLEQLQKELTHQTQNLIAQCMHDFGFEFFPDSEFHTMPFGFYEPDTYISRNERELNGFGIVTGTGRQDRLFSRSLYDGPNGPLIAEMSDEKRREFNRALLGGLPSDFLAYHLTYDDWDKLRRQGCKGWAEERAIVESPLFLGSLGEFAVLIEEMHRAHLEYSNHEMMLAAQQDWSNCMADAGYPTLSRFFVNWAGTDALRLERDTLSLDYCEEEGFGWFCPPELIAEEWHTSYAVAELLDREIAQALADFDCMVATDFQSRRAAIQYEVETRFMETHRDLLEAYREATLTALAQRTR